MTHGRLMLLDTAALYFRAFHGVPESVVAPDGTPVNAVRGLLDMIATLVVEFEPTDLVACWDDDWRPQWRVDLIPSYKAHRVVEANPGGTDVEETPDALTRQIPLIRATLEALGIAIVGAPGYEADDVIGTLAARAQGPVDVVTGDRDLFQVIDDDRDVRVIYTARGMSRLEIVTDATLREKYGVGAAQYADFAALRGDSSDGLPGVAGVGEKTAASLLADYRDLNGIVEASRRSERGGMSGSVRAKIQSAADYLAVAPRVVRVASDVTGVDADTRIAVPDAGRAHILELAETWGLGRSVPRVLSALDTAGARS